MAELIAAGTWAIQGGTITLPVRITDARLTMAAFTAPVSAVGPLLEDASLRPVSVFGRAITMLMVVHYPPWVLQSYDEVALAVVARGPDGRWGTYIVDMPVTGEFTLEAGRDFWAFPKWLMSGEFTFGPAATSARVCDGGTEVMRTVIAAGWFRMPLGTWASLPHWAHLDHGAQAGKLLRGRVPFNLSGVRLGRGGYQVSLGSHPMAERMRALGMTGRPFLTITAARWSGRLKSFIEVPKRDL